MKYNSSRIQYDFRSLDVSMLIDMTKYGRLAPTPMDGFTTAWGMRQKSRAIEMAILGLPNETIWGEEDAFGRIQLLSGFEIVSSYIDFTNNQLSLRGLNVLKHLNGYRHNQLDYAEKRHFERMNLQFGIILYNSDPMLKLLFIENINRSIYRQNSPQLARNIIFKKASATIDSFSDLLENSINYENFLPKTRQNSQKLKLQNDILYCFLVFYLFNHNHPYSIESKVGLESYSYSRSHISFYNDHEAVEIYADDDLDAALNKIMFMLDVENLKTQNLAQEFYYTLRNIAQWEIISSMSLGGTENILSGKLSSSRSLIAHVLSHSFKIRLDSTRTHIKLDTVGDLMDRIDV